MKSPLIYVLALMLLAGNAVAEENQNPLSSFLNGLGKALNTPTAGKGSSGPAVGDEEMAHVVDIVSEGIVSRFERTCDDTYQNGHKRVQTQIDLGQIKMAPFTSHAVAMSLAQCANLVIKKNPSTITTALPDWAMAIGTEMTIGLSLENNQGNALKGRVEQKKIEHATTLLKYADQHGVSGASDRLADLVKLTEAPKEAKASSENAMSFTNVEATSKFQGNMFGFKQKYLEKTLAVTGPIYRIQGDKSYALIRFLGNTKKNIDEIGLHRFR